MSRTPTAKTQSRPTRTACRSGRLRRFLRCFKVCSINARVLVVSLGIYKASSPDCFRWGGVDQNFSDAANKAQRSAYDAQAGLLQPQFDLQRKQTNQQLDDRGLPIGSEARNDATNQLNDSQNRILGSLANSSYGAGLNAQQQGWNQALQNQQLPYSQLGALTAANPTSSLLSSAPGAANLQPSNVANTNVGQIYQNSYQDQLAANQANNSQLFGGLLGLGTLGLSGGTAGFGGSALGRLFGY